jgi:hypothetical protein
MHCVTNSPWPARIESVGGNAGSTAICGQRLAGASRAASAARCQAQCSLRTADRSLPAQTR